MFLHFGWAIDAGVQYVSGEKDNFKLGISLRNIGSPMQFGEKDYLYEERIRIKRMEVIKSTMITERRVLNCHLF